MKKVFLNRKAGFSEQEHGLHQASVTVRLHCLSVNLHLLGKGVYGQGCQAQGVLQMAMIAYSVSGFCSCSIPQLFICLDVEWIQSSLCFCFFVVVVLKNISFFFFSVFLNMVTIKTDIIKLNKWFKSQWYLHYIFP